MTTGNVWLDGNTIYAGLLARDAVGNVENFGTPVYIFLTHPTIGNMSASCIPAGGPCVASISPPSAWFSSTVNVSLAYGLSAATSQYLLSGTSALQLNAAPALSVTNNIVIQLPQRNLLPGDVISVPVYASSSNGVLLFTITFTTAVGINIKSISYSSSVWQATVISNTPQVFFSSFYYHDMNN